VEARLAQKRAVDFNIEARLPTPFSAYPLAPTPFPTYILAPILTLRPIPRVGVTKAMYLQIREGMSYHQVERIIGVLGAEMSRNTLAGYTNVVYQ